MKRSDANPKKVQSGGAKLSEIRDAKGKFGGQFRSDTNLSAVRKAPQMASASDAVRKKPKAANLDPNVKEYAAVLAHAVETFGSRIKANAWLNRPNRMFNHKSPLQILTQDPAAVEEELVRIDYGIFA